MWASHRLAGRLRASYAGRFHVASDGKGRLIAPDASSCVRPARLSVPSGRGATAGSARELAQCFISAHLSHHAAGVSGTIEKDRHVGDFAWPGCAPEREAFHQFAVDFSSPNSLPPARVFDQGDVTVSFDRSRIDPNNANAMVQALVKAIRAALPALQ